MAGQAIPGIPNPAPDPQDPWGNENQQYPEIVEAYLLTDPPPGQEGAGQLYELFKQNWLQYGVPTQNDLEKVRATHQKYRGNFSQPSQQQEGMGKPYSPTFNGEEFPPMMTKVQEFLQEPEQVAITKASKGGRSKGRPTEEPKPGFLAKLEKKLKGMSKLSKIERGEIAKQLSKIPKGKWVETSPGHAGMPITHFIETSPIERLKKEGMARDIGLGEASSKQTKLDLKGAKLRLDQKEFGLKGAEFLSKEQKRKDDKALKASRWGLDVMKWKEENIQPYTTRAYEHIARNHPGKTKERYAAADDFMNLYLEKLAEKVKVNPKSGRDEELQHQAASEALRELGYDPQNFIPWDATGVGQLGSSGIPQGPTYEQDPAKRKKTAEDIFPTPAT